MEYGETAINNMNRWLTNLITCLAVTISMQAFAQQGSVSAVIRPESGTLYVNQTFDFDLIVTASGVTLAKEMNLMNMPDQKVLRFEKFDELPPVQEVVNGVATETRRFRCKARAQRPGVIQLSPGLDIGVLQRRNTIFGTTVITTSKRMGVSPVMLSIMPIPEKDKPKDFSGCIGNLAFEASVSPHNPAPGDLITLSYSITGTANMDEFKAPAYSDLPGFKVYEVRKIPSQNPNISQYEQVLMPLGTNALTVPKLSLTFFEPSSGTYKTVSKGPFNLIFQADKAAIYEKYRPDDAISKGSVSNKTRSVISAGYEDAKKVSRETWVQAITSAVMLVISVMFIRFIFITLSFAAKTSKTQKALKIVLACALLSACTYLSYHIYTGSNTTKSAQYITKQDDEARIAPSASAAPICHLPKGSNVQVTERYRNWIKIESGISSGWIRADSI